MILQALCDYYDRKAAQGEMPIAGREWKPIPYLVVINNEGGLVRLESTYEGEGRQRKAKQFMLCRAREHPGPNSWAKGNSLWGSCGYVFGLPKKMDFADAESVLTGQRKCQTFQKELQRLRKLNPDDAGLKAVMAFYAKLEDNIARLRNDELFEEAFKKDGTYFAFRLLSDTAPVGTGPNFDYGGQDADAPVGLCLVTGERRPIAVTNDSVPLRHALPGGAKLVGFQKNSGYDSYHKEQGMNAPVSLQANAAYTMALKTMLAPTSKNKLFFGKDTLLFWAGKDNKFEDLFSAFFSAPPADDPDSHVERITALMKAPLTGTLTDDDDTRFYLLLLSPNEARISVKLWQETTVRTLSQNMRQYFDDLSIVRGPADKEYMPLASLLRSIALQNKEKNLPPVLFPAMMRAIIGGMPLPQLLQVQTLMRIKADRKISCNCAALLKAYLNRKRNQNEKQITMSLDLTNNNQAYLCGRLLAIYEKIQQEANPGGVNSGVRDKYFDSFSCTPTVAFARLAALSNHHLQKLQKGKQVYFERLKGDVFGRISANGLPHHFSLDDQARFAIGYYHQRQDFYTKKDDAGGVNEEM